MKKQISLLLALVFLGTVLGPTMINMFSTDVETAVILALGEEDRETEEKESDKPLEFKLFVSSYKQSDYILDSANTKYDYHLNLFKELHKENISPPPEWI